MRGQWRWRLTWPRWSRWRPHTPPTVDFLGPVDILVNAAAIIGVDASVLETPLDEWDRVLAVNLTGTYLASRLVVGGMAERGWGRIVNFTSGARHGVACSDSLFGQQSRRRAHHPRVRA